MKNKKGKELQGNEHELNYFEQNKKLIVFGNCQLIQYSHCQNNHILHQYNHRCFVYLKNLFLKLSHLFLYFETEIIDYSKNLHLNIETHYTFHLLYLYGASHHWIIIIFHRMCFHILFC